MVFNFLHLSVSDFSMHLNRRLIFVFAVCLLPVIFTNEVFAGSNTAPELIPKWNINDVKKVNLVLTLNHEVSEEDTSNVFFIVKLNSKVKVNEVNDSGYVLTWQTLNRDIKTSFGNDIYNSAAGELEFIPCEYKLKINKSGVFEALLNKDQIINHVMSSPYSSASPDERMNENQAEITIDKELKKMILPFFSVYNSSYESLTDHKEYLPLSEVDDSVYSTFNTSVTNYDDSLFVTVDVSTEESQREKAAELLKKIDATYDEKEMFMTILNITSHIEFSVDKNTNWIKRKTEITKAQGQTITTEYYVN